MDGTIDPETLYTKQDCIGGGSFGRVYKGLDRRTGETVAIKVIDVEEAEDEVEDVIREIAILSELRSPYVTQYYGSYLKDSDLWIIMEYCSGGSCGNLLKPGVMGEEYIAIIMREMLLGLQYLHQDKKLHRDIKAANVLLASNGQIKLADFGVSGQITATVSKKNTFVGTPFWMAPEVIGSDGYDTKADLWSLGITAIELAQGEPPYSELHPMKVLFVIPDSPPPELHGSFSTAFKDFVRKCCTKQPDQRPGTDELLKHPFITRAKNMTYLTELIERYERWSASRQGHESDSENESMDRQPRRGELTQDHWDFGTIKASTKGLRAMNSSDQNARAGRGSDKLGDLHKKSSAGNGRIQSALESRDMQAPEQRTAIRNRSRSPQKGVPLLPPLNFAAEVPLPASPDKHGNRAPEQLAVKVPLPASPVKTKQHGSITAATQTQLPASPLKPTSPRPEQSPDSNLQRFLSDSLESLQIQTNGRAPEEAEPARLPPEPKLRPQSQVHKAMESFEAKAAAAHSAKHAPPTPTRNPARKLLGPLNLPEIPPFMGFGKDRNVSPSKSSRKTHEPPSQPLDSAKPLSPLPAPNMIQARQNPAAMQRPLPTTDGAPIHMSTYTPNPLPSPAASTSSLVPSVDSASSSISGVDQTKEMARHEQDDPNATALGAVLVPAFEAALHRRAVMVASAVRNARATPQYTAQEQAKNLSKAHEKIRNLVVKTAALLGEIQRLDDDFAVGMGSGGDTFLEGFLEEILLRVEPEDL